MDSLLDKYKDVWSPIIEPDDYKYSMAELDPETVLLVDGTKVARQEFTVSNLKG